MFHYVKKCGSSHNTPPWTYARCIRDLQFNLSSYSSLTAFLRLAVQSIPGLLSGKQRVTQNTDLNEHFPPILRMDVVETVAASFPNRPSSVTVQSSPPLSRTSTPRRCLQSVSYFPGALICKWIFHRHVNVRGARIKVTVGSPSTPLKAARRVAIKHRLIKAQRHLFAELHLILVMYLFHVLLCLFSLSSSFLCDSLNCRRSLLSLNIELLLICCLW